MTSVIHNHANGRLVQARGVANVQADAQVTLDDIQALGADLRAMDAALLGGGSGGVPGFVSADPLTTWLPGTLRAITVARDIDNIVGITQVGKFEDETLKIRTEEAAGHASLYGDNAQIPFADIRTGVEGRDVVRFEQGFTVGELESIRLGASGYQAQAAKRKAAIDSLENSRNAVGFRGFTGGQFGTFGLLNDPNLSNYKSLTTAWKSATFDEITGDISAMINSLETQMGGHLQDTTSLLLVIPTGYRQVLQVMQAVTGVSVKQWLETNYPNIRIVATAQFVGAADNADVAYLIAENVAGFDDSDIEGATIIQAVPVKYRVLGSEQGIKSYIEDAVNATAGVIVLRPWAVVRQKISA